MENVTNKTGKVKIDVTTWTLTSKESKKKICVYFKIFTDTTMINQFFSFCKNLLFNYIIKVTWSSHEPVFGLRV